MPTIRDVAQRAGVSAGTVSNVLNRPAYVRRETRDRVLEAIEALGFVPTQDARQYRPGRIRTVGVALANIDNPFFVDVGLAIEERLRQLGVGVVFCNSGYDRLQESHNLDLLTQFRVQGMIIAPIDESSSRLEMLHDRGAPIVFVDRVADVRDSWSVLVDDVEGGRIGARYLIERGHRRVAFLGHFGETPKVDLRLRGAEEIVSKSGGSLDVLRTQTWTVEAGQAAASRVIDMPLADRPTAIFCANDMLAIGLQQQLLRHGVRVPEDIAIVGYDDLTWAAMAGVPLTTVRQPRRELGSTAADLLIQRLEDPSVELSTSRRVVLQPVLVARESA